MNQPRSMPTVMWKPEGDRTDNIEEVENLLIAHEARCKRVGDNLLLQAWGGLNTELAPGDCLVLDGDRLGIIRTETPGTPARIEPDN